MTKNAIPPKSGVPPRRILRLGPLAFPLLLLTSVFLYVWLRIDPSVEYNWSGPFLFFNGQLLRPFLARPGGLGDCAAVLVAQLNYFGWPGALAFAALSGAIYGLAQWVLHRGWGVVSRAPAVALILLLLLARNTYGSPALSLAFGLIVALLAAGLDLKFLKLPLLWRLSGVAILAVLVFYLAGVWPLGLLALLVLMAELKSAPRWHVALGLMLAAVLPFALFLLLSETSLMPLLIPWSAKSVRIAAIGLYAVLPLGALAALLFPGARVAALAASKAHDHQEKRPTSTRVRIPWYQYPGFSRAVLALIFAAAIAGLVFTFDQALSVRARIDYYANQKEFGKVLAVARSMPATDFGTQARLHLALYHSGRMTSELFSYPCMSELLPGVLGGLSSCRGQSQALFELGLISEAEHLAHEALEFEGNRPDLLRTLAQVNVLKGRPKAAKVFLNVLNQMPFGSLRASAQLQQLAASPTLESDPEVSRIRSCLLTNDFAHSGLPTEALLSRLLSTNPRNQMAFEYLLSSYLITLNLPKACASVPLLEDFGYQGLPRHLEEALLLHEKLNGVKVDLRGRRISPATLDRFQKFVTLMTRLPDQGIQSRRTLGSQFGDTYWFYYVIREADSKAPAPRTPPAE